jgi:hypothetical protein
MPLLAKDLAKATHLRMLCIGAARVGKTYLINSCPRPVYVIYSDFDVTKLDSATRVSDDFVYDEVNETDGGKLLAQTEVALREARYGKYATVVWDTISTFALNLCNAALGATDKGNGSDGRQAYDTYGRHLVNTVGRLLHSSVKSHVLVLSHDRELSPEIAGQAKKRGEGILPNIPGGIRNMVPGMFRDVVYIEKKKSTQERFFVTGPDGVYRANCQTLPGYETFPADIEKFIAEGKKLDAARLPPNTKKGK